MTRREALTRLGLTLAGLVAAGGLLTTGCTRSEAGNVPRVIADKCVGCDRCVQIAPKTFRLNQSTRKAEVADPEGDPPATIREAAARCPTQAIVF